MEILSNVFADVIFALMFLLYCRVMQGMPVLEKDGKNVTMQVVQIFAPALLFAAVMVPVSLLFEFQSAHPVITDIFGALLVMTVIISASVFMWNKTAKIFKIGIVFMAYLMCVLVSAVPLVATFVIGYLLSFDNLPLLQIIAYILSIPLHYIVYTDIKRCLAE